MAAKNPFGAALIAPCGMSCAICMANLREKDQCPGCASADHSFRQKCTIASCPQVKERFRHECGKFPCRRLKQLDRRHRTKYGMSMLDNPGAIRAGGIHAFVKTGGNAGPAGNVAG